MPRIGSRVAGQCLEPISLRPLAGTNVPVGLYVFHRFCISGSDGSPHFLGRCHRFALTHTPGNAFNFLHETVETRTAKRNLATATVENSRRQRALERQHRKHALLDGALCHEIDHPHRPRLAHAVDACDALFEDCRIPRQIHVHQSRSMLQIETRAAGISGQEHPASRVVAKPLDQCRPLLRWHAAVEADIAVSMRFETADDDVMGPRPLRKHHRLGLGIGEQLVEQCRQFVGLDAVVGFLVQQIGAVARHPHVLQGNHQPPLIHLGQKPGLAPAPDDFRHLVGVFLMVIHLHLGHRHQQVLVGPGGQLPQHLGFAASDHDRRQRLADLLQSGIAGDAPGFVLDLMLMQQLPGWPQPVLIDELDDGDQFLQLVFQGRTGQHDRIGTIDAFQGACRNRVPVLHPLRFIDDDQFGRPFGYQVEIGLELLVICNLAEVVQAVVLRPQRPTAADDARRLFALPPGKARDLALPLVFERGRADHQNLRDAKVPRQYFGRGNCLNGLAKPHIVADQRPASPHRKQRALGLIGIQRDLQNRS